MIIWDGFGKLLKPLFSILLIGFFGLFVGSFVNAQYLLGNLQGVGQTFGSFYNNDYQIQVNGKGNLLTQYLGDGKKLLYFQNGTYFFRSTQNDSKPYISVSAYNGQYNKRNQGYVKYYFLCDYISDGSVVNPTNCVRHNIDDGEFPGVAQRLLNSLSNGGYLYYNYYDFYVRSSSSPDYGGLDVCFSSSEFNKSLCFYGGLTYSQQYCDSFYNNTLGKQFQTEGSWCNTIQSLDNSLSLNYNFDSISQSILGNSPAGAGNGLGGSDNVIIDNNLTGDYSYTTCTYREIYDYSNSVGASPSLCYGGLDNFDLYDSSLSYNPIPGTGKTLSQILTNAMNTWDTPMDWFNFWNGLRGGYVNMWESYPAVYKTWFDIYYSYNGDLLDFDYVREYCIIHDLIKNDSSILNQVYNGQYFSQTCNYIKRNPTINSSGQVSLGVNWDGVGNMGSGQTFTNPKIAIQSFFDRLKSNMTTDYFGLGAIPQYIIFFLMALILFRFLAH